jgi:hypothetical protein
VLERSTRPDQLTGILERAGLDVKIALAQTGQPSTSEPAMPALRMAGS